MLYATMAVLPVCILIVWLYTRDKLHPEPKRRVFSLFLRGAGIVLPAGIIERLLLASKDGNTLGIPQLQLPGVIITAFFVAGMVEEFLKASIVDRGAVQRGWIHEPMDAILYAGSTALGFACVENVLYVTHAGIGTALLRAVTAVPAHLMFGVWMGSLFAESIFRNQRRWRAYIVPALAHGLYDAFALSSSLLTDILLGVYLLILLEGSLRRIDRAKQLLRATPSG